ncbi:hypothetical protein GA353_24670, partial [Escherichia coli]|nr:hypothetical protein [Escherichia coli]EFH9435083.1 hypothetical protein [Escherichia coli]EFN6905486.1 hypothetical protein [Escherichia coli]
EYRFYSIQNPFQYKRLYYSLPYMITCGPEESEAAVSDCLPVHLTVMLRGIATTKNSKSKGNGAGGVGGNRLIFRYYRLTACG